MVGILKAQIMKNFHNFIQSIVNISKDEAQAKSDLFFP